MAAKKLAPKIYVVSSELTGDSRLVKAVSKASAIKHVVGKQFEASVATQDQLVEALQFGAQVEVADAKEDEPQAELADQA